MRTSAQVSPGPRGSGVIRSRLVLLILAAALVAVPETARAHSSLTTSSPAAESTVDRADELRLGFSNPVGVDAKSVRVYDLRGNELPHGSPVVDGNDVVVELDDEGPGTRVVFWDAVSDHGTPITGGFIYHVGEPTDGISATVPGSLEVAEEITHLATALAAGSLIVAAVASLLALVFLREHRAWLVFTAWSMQGMLVMALIGLGGAWLAGVAVTERSPTFRRHAESVMAAPLGTDHAVWSLGLAALVVVLLASRGRFFRRDRHAAWAGTTLVFCVAGLAVLTIANPPELGAQRIEHRVELNGGTHRARAQIAPAAAGQNTIAVSVAATGEHRTPDAESAYIKYTPLARQGGALRHELKMTGEGEFSSDDLIVPFPGPWRIELHVVLNEFEESLVAFQANFQPNANLE